MSSECLFVDIEMTVQRAGSVKMFWRHKHAIKSVFCFAHVVLEEKYDRLKRARY